MLRRLPALAGLAAVAGVGAEVSGYRAFTRLVRLDIRGPGGGGYGEFDGLRFPVRGPAIWELHGGDFKCIEVTITDLHYDTSATPPEGRAR